MTPFDWIIIAAYLGGTLLMSAWLARTQVSPDDYYVGGRTMPWWALALSTLATQSSANSFIGIPAFVALVPGGGLVWLQYELMVPLAMIVVMLLLAPMFRGLALISVYEYLELRFDRLTRQLLSAVFLASRALATGVALYAAAIVVQVCSGLPLFWCVLMMGGVTVVYDLMGGMQAVVWTDVMQMVVMVAGIALCGVLAWQQVGGLEPLLAAHAPARLAGIEAGHGLGDGASAPLWGFVVGGFVLYIAYYGVDQTQVQRQLAASGVADAQRLLLWNGLARFPLTLGYVALGLAIGAVYVHEAALRAAVPPARVDFLVPRFIELYLPAGARGLLVAAILAAAMSSLDSALNSLSASAMRDFIEPRVPPARHLLASRLTTLTIGVFITGVGMLTGELAGSVVEAINRVGALFYGPLLAAFACGMLDRRATGAAVRWGVAAGLAVNLALWLGLGAQLFWMWWNATGLLVSVATTVLLSRLGPAADRPIAPALLWRLRAGDVDRPLRRSLVLLVAYAALMMLLLLALGVR